MTDPKADTLATLANEEYCYLTTTGRVTGRPHEIEIWFGLLDRAVYMLSGNGERSDWVKNLRQNPRVTVRIGGETLQGVARIVTDADEQARVRPLLAAKYDEYEKDGRMSDWARTALAVAVDVEKG